VHVRKGDLVRIIAGNDKGKTGKVLGVRPASGRVIVEGLNMVKKHVRPMRENPGGIVEQPAPLASSNVMLVCPSCNQPTRIRRVRGGDGKLTRECKKCNKPID
jgi:large subunit ribosomal protein L24